MMYLKIITGPQSGLTTELNFDNNNKFIIGRLSSKNGLALIDNRVSKQHAEISRKDKEYYIKDLNSTNGTYMDGKRVAGELKINLGNLIKAGTTIMEIVSEGVPSQAAASGPIPVDSGKPSISAEEDAGSTTTEIKLDVDENFDGETPEKPLGKEVTSKILPMMHQISRLIMSEKEIPHMLEQILKQTITATSADRGYVIMVDKKTDKISSHIAHPKKDTTQEPPVSHTIIKYVTKNTRPLVTSDAMLDKRLDPSSSIADGSIKSVICVPLITTSTHYGVIYLENFQLEKYFGQAELEIASAISILAGMGIITVSAAEKTERTMMGTLRAFLTIIEMKMPQMQGHSERVANIASNIARQMKLAVPEVKRVNLAALLHDVGRIMETADEAETTSFKDIEKHSLNAEKLLNSIPDLHDIIPAIKYHHERIDGTGFFKMESKNIPVNAKILAVANEIDNLMTLGGPQAQGISIKEAIAEIQSHANKTYDADVVKAMVACYDNDALFKTESSPLKSIV
ncbi:MAG: HD domain-containing phosphohydrolase [Planctomycetota bacterium]